MITFKVPSLYHTKAVLACWLKVKLSLPIVTISVIGENLYCSSFRHVHIYWNSNITNMPYFCWILYSKYERIYRGFCVVWTMCGEWEAAEWARYLRGVLSKLEGKGARRKGAEVLVTSSKGKSMWVLKSVCLLFEIIANACML